MQSKRQIRKAEEREAFNTSPMDDNSLLYWANESLGGSGPIHIMRTCKRLAIMVLTERGIDYKTLEYKKFNIGSHDIYVNGKYVRTESSEDTTDVQY